MNKLFIWTYIVCLLGALAVGLAVSQQAKEMNSIQDRFTQIERAADGIQKHK